MPALHQLPIGTLTFLFTDIEGSTRRWEERRDLMQVAFARQEAIMRQAIEATVGYRIRLASRLP